MITDVFLSVITTNTTIEEKICLTLIFPGMSIIYFECNVYACPALFQIQNGRCVIRVYSLSKVEVNAFKPITIIGNTEPTIICLIV